MTNIEKYPNTADAVEAWNEYKESGNSNISFENWLGQLYEALRIAYEQITSGNVRCSLPLGLCAKARAALEKAGGAE